MLITEQKVASAPPSEQGDGQGCQLESGTWKGKTQEQWGFLPHDGDTMGDLRASTNVIPFCFKVSYAKKRNFP